MAAKKKYGMGRLYKRFNRKEYPASSPVKGKFWLEYRINGVRKRDALHDSAGKPITKLREAEKEQERILTPLMKMQDKEKLEVIKARIESTEEEYQLSLTAQNPPLALAGMWQVFVDSREYYAGERTLSDYQSKVNRFLNWVKQYDKSIRDMKNVTEEIAKAFSRYLIEHFSANTHNKYLMLLTQMFDVLAKEAQIHSNPFSTVRKVPTRKVKAQTNSKRMLTVEELRTVVEQAQGDLKMLFCIGIYTGLRLGDCATLRWQEVDFDRRLIIRQPLKTKTTSGKLVKIGMSEDLIAALSSHAEKTKGRNGCVLPKIAEEYQRQKGSALTKRIQIHFRFCGIETLRPGTGKIIDPECGKKISTGKRAITEVGFHSLRHTFVSLHAEAGTPQGVIRDLVGHGNVAMTVHYEHISDATVIRCASQLPSIMGIQKELDGDKKLPDWVRKKLQLVTANNWTNIRDELLAHA